MVSGSSANALRSRTPRHAFSSQPWSYSLEDNVYENTHSPKHELLSNFNKVPSQLHEQRAIRGQDADYCQSRRPLPRLYTHRGTSEEGEQVQDRSRLNFSARAENGHKVESLGRSRYGRVQKRQQGISTSLMIEKSQHVLMVYTKIQYTMR